MKRPWTALAPCPLGKVLVNGKCRKVFYFLTNTPHQPLPENMEDIVDLDEKRLTPSLSSGSVDQDEDDAMARERSRLSPSPEIDLFSPDFDDDRDDTFDTPHPSASHSSQNHSHHHHPHHPHHHRLSHNHRAVSPPLEGDEREFTQTASSLRERASEERAGRQSSLVAVSLPTFDDMQQSEIEGFPGSPMDAEPLTAPLNQNTQYDRYLSEGSLRDQDQDLDNAAVATLFGTSPSPSLTSVATSLSSGTTTPPEAELNEVSTALSYHGHLLPPSTSALVIDDKTTASHSLKRSFDLVETGFPTKSMTDSRLSYAFDFEMVVDSWADLRSPETVEVDELDEIFGDF